MSVSVDTAMAEALLKSGADIGMSEVLDIAWLARRISAAPGRPAEPAPTVTPPTVHRDAAGPGAGPRATATGPAGGARAAGLDLYPREAAAVLAAAGGLTGDVAAPAVPRALPDPIGLGRALHALRRTRPSPVRQEVDEELSAQWTAATGMVLPVCRPAPEPYYDLTLVCDDTGPSMRLWGQLLREAAQGAERSRSFRSVTVRRLCSAGDRMVLRSPGGDTGLGELVEPNGRRVVAFLTDGVGGGWHDGRMAGQLHRLAGYGPVVVVHLLPRHLWPRTGINPLPVYFRPDPDGGGSVRGAGGTHGFRPAGWSLEELRPGGVPADGGDARAVPVVPLAAAPLTRWASLVTGDDGRTVSGSAWIVSARHRPGVPYQALGAAPPRAEATALLREFDATATLRARRLLRSLSVAPLNLDTMWLVHRATSLAAGEHSDPAPLAEVFLSGLLRKRPGDAAAPRGASEYEFVGDLRRRLFEGMEGDDALRLFTVVSRYVTGLFGLTPLTFPAFLASREQRERASEIDPEVRPLAEIAALVLRGLGPAYRSAVEAVEQWLARSGVDVPQRQKEPRAVTETTAPAPDTVLPPALAPATAVLPDTAPPTDPPGAVASLPARGPAPAALPAPKDAIAVLGAPSSGKTSLLGALRLAAIRSPVGRGRWAIVPEDTTAEHFMILQSNYLAVERRFPDATLTPRGFTYRFLADLPDPDSPDGGRRQVDFGVDFFDAHGSEFMHGHGMDPDVDRHLAAARRILLLVDPFPDKGGEGLQEENVAPPLRRLSGEYAARDRLIRDRLPHHVAVCVSKFDQPRLFALARSGGWVNQNADGDPCVAPEDAGPFAAWLAGHSTAVADVRRLVGEHFLPERVSWFVLSAVGFHRRPDGSLDPDDCYNVVHDGGGALLRGPARPVNVLEPLVALGLSDED
ncbi:MULTISPECIES: SAV_2336 N-terminal domain-related protein [unclassified Streptomyces]|uniref:SAV_2336 N-terminal domain-related protein n=1 Tax=unclassified Streptomyces TaxID=2593676 RepID=UPI002E2E6EE5|nr:SAV_2336 N-terminal domain-related protein [Streptomyces sp. NBC_00223]